MKITHAIVIGLCGISAFGKAQAAEINPMTQAVMEVYAEQLAATPHDYTILLSRAYEYYNLGEYLKAIDDVNAALKYTTREDKEVLVEEYMLRAQIYEMRGEFQLALNDLSEALKIAPDSQKCISKLADVNYLLGNYEAAKNEYQQLLRANSLNYEALAGLAKVAVQQKNLGLAREYVDRGVSLYPAQAAVYVNRADVFNLMGQYDAAAHDLITAVTLDYQKSGALDKLVKMSNENYKSVISALDDAVSKAPDSGMLYYLRSGIALEHCHYANALKDINKLIDGNIYNNDGIYNDCAEANFHLGKYDVALNNINQAILINPTDPLYYVLKSKILTALNTPKKALDALNLALNTDPNDVYLLAEKGLVEVILGNPKEGLKYLNEAILNDSETLYNYILRAWVQKDYLKNTIAAKADYDKVIKQNVEGLDSYRGFALHYLGRDAEAKQWIEELINTTSTAGGKIYYYSAALYSQCGDLEKGMYYLEGALANGFGSYYDLMVNDEAGISIAPLRKLPRFKELMAQYKSNF